jgi:hypothetical protein
MHSAFTHQYRTNLLGVGLGHPDLLIRNSAGPTPIRPSRAESRLRVLPEPPGHPRRVPLCPPPPDALSHPSPPPTTYRTPSSPLPFAPRLFAPPPPPFPMLLLIFSTYTNRVCFLSPPCPPMTPQTPPAPPSIPNPHGCNARNTLTSPRRLSRWSRSFLSWGVINLQPD